jgi:hypothetical protein
VLSSTGGKYSIGNRAPRSPAYELLSILAVTVVFIGRACRAGCEKRPKSAANSILTANHLSGQRIDYGNDNGNGNDFSDKRLDQLHA